MRGLYLLIIALLNCFVLHAEGSDTLWCLQLVNRSDTSKIRYVHNDKKVVLKFIDQSKIKGRLNIQDSTNIGLKNAKLVFAGPELAAGRDFSDYNDIIQLQVRSRNILLGGTGIFLAESILYSLIMDNYSGDNSALIAVNGAIFMGIMGGSLYMIIHPYLRFNLKTKWHMTIIPANKVKPGGNFIQ